MPNRDFDHAYLLVASLKEATRALRRLGFTTTPEGHHGNGLGTANTTAMMPDRRTYLELLSVVEPTPRNADKQALLAAEGNHLRGIAFAWSVADAQRAFVKAGMAAGPVFDFSRPVDLSSGRAEASFSIAQLREDAVAGASLFAITHHSRDVVWRKDCLKHANGAKAVTRLVGICPAPLAIARPWQAIFGSEVSVDADGLRLRTGTAEVVFLSPRAFEGQYGMAAEADRTRLNVVEIAVADVHKTSLLLEDAGIERTTPTGGGCLTSSQPALGVAFHFVATPG